VLWNISRLENHQADVKRSLQNNIGILGAQPVKNFVNSKHRSSFLHRVFYSYQDYISQYRMDPRAGVFRYRGNPRLLPDTETVQVDRTILANFDFTMRSNAIDPFPGSSVEFLYNFLIYLYHHEADREAILKVEGEGRYHKFSKALEGIYKQFGDINKIVEHERQTGSIDMKRRVVEYMAMFVPM